MSSNRGNNRRRGRGNNRQQGGGQQINRIDSRARGNAPQLLEKYRKMAHDAHLNGDRVLEEYYLQFADHYFRVIADTRQRQEEARQRREERWQDSDSDREESGDGGDSGEYGSDSYGSSYGNDGDYSSRYRESDDSSDEEQDGANGEDARNDGERSAYEPPENPFVRDNRGTRAAKTRRPRREDRAAAAGEDGRAGVDPASLPPAISAGRDEAPAPRAPKPASEPSAEAAGEPAEAASEPAPKPRRRTRRKPASDDTGEPLQSVG